MPAEILLVEDTRSLSQLYVSYLKTSGCKITAVETGQAALARLDAGIPAVALLDLQLPDMNGMDILRAIRQRGLPTEVIVITANGSINIAVEAMREGAADFLVKPFPAERLRVTLRNALERSKLRAAVDTLQESDRGRCGDFIGGSLAMQAVYRIIDSAAASKASVFITGESGTGKELCADALHRRSPRRAGPFVALNCAALPRELIESEIFGHVKGAFTGATSDREGAAKRAHNGTLFLDEICEMDLALQAKLLRFLQTGTVQRVGSDRSDAVDIRVVCATNRDPAAEVKAGRFREDLFYRLQVIPIELPPLREREDDVLLLARHFLERYGREEKRSFNGFSADAEAALRRHDWPGNVRELQNVIRNVAVLNQGGTVTADMLPANLRKAAPAAQASAPPPAAASRSEAPSRQIRPLWQVERETIEAAIKACDGNVPRAAALLEVSPSTIYRKLQAWAESDSPSAGRASA
jgi:two-component system repressor protein LuxO